MSTCFCLNLMLLLYEFVSGDYLQLHNPLHCCYCCCCCCCFKYKYIYVACCISIDWILLLVGWFCVAQLPALLCWCWCLFMLRTRMALVFIVGRYPSNQSRTKISTDVSKQAFKCGRNDANNLQSTLVQPLNLQMKIKCKKIWN